MRGRALLSRAALLGGTAALAVACRSRLAAVAARVGGIWSHPVSRLGAGELLALLELLLILALLAEVGLLVAQPRRTGLMTRRSGARMSVTDGVPPPLAATGTGTSAPALEPAGAEEGAQMSGEAWEATETAARARPGTPRLLEVTDGPAPSRLTGRRLVSELSPEAPRPRQFPAVRLQDPEWTRAVVGLLAAIPPGAGRAVALTLSAGAVEVHFSEQATRAAAPPFENAGERSWRLVRSFNMLAELPETRTVVSASRRAALVTAAGGGANRTLLDLVAAKSLALDGPPVAVGATLSDIVVELATRQWCDLDELIVVGFGHELVDLEGVQCLSSSDEARAYLLAAASVRNRMTWGRCVVAAPPSKSVAADASLRSLVDLVQTLPDTGLVCCDPSIAAIRTIWQLETHRRTRAVVLRSPGRPLVQLPLPAAEEAVAVSATARQAASQKAPRSAPPGGEPAGVVVSVLGPVEVQNTSEPLTGRKRLIELIVYLAMHPEGCSGEALSTAVWPDRRVPTQTVANRLSEARRILGTAGDGRVRLTRALGQHVLHDVATDWHRLQTTAAGEPSLGQMLEVIELIRGRPFEGVSETGWALIEGHIATMEATISELACRAASLALQLGELAAAERAVRRCLLASPWDERLYRMLMTVCHAAGNRGGVEEALRSLARVLEWEGQPIEGVHPETARLYRRLMSE